ncbi:PA0069 family radical SAM protein [Orrella sp. JC864]|uniref:PA0069 family radical SAM protein n=1 Tax=Orrella sp. JC864 TaxID=3120298 RepID=UPI00300BCC5B
MVAFDTSCSAGPGSPAAAPAALRGRGAVTNVAHRFQRDARGIDTDTLERDAQEGELAPHPATRVQAEQARRLISRNDSPDIPFEQAVNPYRGCEHGCIYCYARPTHAYLGYSPGLDFETRLVAKENAVAALRAELARPGYVPKAITLGSATDAYQPIERQWRLARGVLELMLETRHPVSVITKNALVERDLDLLVPLAELNLVSVHVSLTTLDADVARTLEPRASAPWRRLQALRRLSEAGVPTGVGIAPVIPFINDDQIERIVQAAAQAGVGQAFYTIVRLPYEVREVFEQWLQAHYPERAGRVLHRIEDLRGGRRNDPRFGTRMRGTGTWAELIAQRFRIAVARAGLADRLRGGGLAHDLFQPPAAARPGHAPRQLGLFEAGPSHG